MSEKNIYYADRFTRMIRSAGRIKRIASVLLALTLLLTASGVPGGQSHRAYAADYDPYELPPDVPVYEIDPPINTVPPMEAAVTNIKKTGGIRISWDAVSGAEYYRIFAVNADDSMSSDEVSAAEPDDFVPVCKTAKLYYNAPVGMPGSTRIYKVAAEKKNGEVVAETGSLFAVNGLERPRLSAKSAAASGLPYVSWKAVDYADRYIVLRSENGGHAEQVDIVSGLSYTDKSALPGVRYTYQVIASGTTLSASSASSLPVSVTCAPARPVISVSRNKTTGKPVVKWDAVNTASFYRVYRAVGSKDGQYELVSAIHDGSMSYTDMNALPGTTYYYKVKAVCSGGIVESAFSLPKGKTCSKPVVNAPVLSVSASGNVISVNWNEVETANRYKLFRSDRIDGEYVLTATTGKTGYTDAAPIGATVLYYKAFAMYRTVDENTGIVSTVNSDYSIPVSVTVGQ